MISLRMRKNEKIKNRKEKIVMFKEWKNKGEEMEKKILMGNLRKKTERKNIRSK